MTDQEQNAIDWIKIVRGTACTGLVNGGRACRWYWLNQHKFRRCD